MSASIVSLDAYRTAGSSALAREVIHNEVAPCVCISECLTVSVGPSPDELIHDLKADMRWQGIHGVERILSRFSPCTVAAVLTYLEDEVDRGAPIRDKGALFVRLLEKATGRRVWRDETCEREEGLLAAMMGCNGV